MEYTVEVQHLDCNDVHPQFDIYHPEGHQISVYKDDEATIEVISSLLSQEE